MMIPQLPDSVSEPPFPLCPCWCCLGNYDFFYYTGLCGEVLLPAVTTVLQHPGALLRDGSLRPAALTAQAIRRYQTEVSAKTPARCHFVPSCSNYGLQAVQRFGFVGGVARTIGRLFRCRIDVPWGTLDAVPAR